ncbi:MAG TPA: hypothetical protein VI685_14745 [Candidatus Angelobacter sp.]
MPATLHPASNVQDFGADPERLPGDNTALVERARQVGSALGRMVVALRQTRTKLRDTATRTTDAVVSQIQEGKQQVKTKYEEAKTGAQHVLHDYPVHVVLAAGAVGLLLGVGIRIWRASHEQ